MKPSDHFQIIPGSGASRIPALSGKGHISIPEGGQLSLQITTPRPLRLWIGRHLVVNDAPQRDSTHIFRVMHLGVTLPIEAGTHEVVTEFGPRSHQISFVDDQCASAYRPAIEERLLQEIPDQLEISASLTPAMTGPALCLRFEPGHFRQDGWVWQDVWVRRIPGFDSLYPIWRGWHEAPVSWEPTLRTDVAPEIAARAVPLWTGRPSNEYRFYVPVMPSGAGEPTARKLGEENRAEPYRESIGHIGLEVSDPAGTARLSMPIMETVGKHAPSREFRLIAPPCFEEVWEAVPHPILSPAWKPLGDLYRHAWQQICKLWRPVQPESGLPNGYVGTAETHFAHSLFVWDSSFTALAYAYAWRVFPVYASLDCLYSRQEDGGHIERHNDVRDNLPSLLEPGFGPNPPLMALAELAIARISGNGDRLRQVYRPLKEHFIWIHSQRRLPDGTYWTTGLANGLDNSPSSGVGYPDLTAQMAHFAEHLAQIAREIGADSEVADWLRMRDEIGTALNDHLWSDDLGCYSTSLPDGTHVRHKIITTFWPLWSGIVPEDRVALLADLARNPATFNRPHPLPSLSADSELFDPRGSYWRGSVWAPTSAASIQGFWRSGEKSLARDFCLRHLQTLQQVFAQTGIFWENYAPDYAEQGNASCANYSWTAANAISLLLEILLGLEPDAPRSRLKWTLPETLPIGVANYPLGANTISLQCEMLDGSPVIEIHCDHAFELEVLSAEFSAQRSFTAGSSTWKLDL